MDFGFHYPWSLWCVKCRAGSAIPQPSHALSDKIRKSTAQCSMHRTLSIYYSTKDYRYQKGTNILIGNFFDEILHNYFRKTNTFTNSDSLASYAITIGRWMGGRRMSKLMNGRQYRPTMAIEEVRNAAPRTFRFCQRVPSSIPTKNYQRHYKYMNEGKLISCWNCLDF